MFFLKKNKHIANMVIEDYCIRLLINNGKDLASAQSPIEQALPTDVIRNGKIVDQAVLLDILQEMVMTYDLKGMPVRFYMPHALIIMREIEIPTDVIDEEVKQYITMEIGNTIHFPFTNPIFDVYHIRVEEGQKKVTMFATSEEEALQYTAVLANANLKPIAADVQALGAYRYLHLQQITDTAVDPDRAYLFLELNLTSSNISIFRPHLIEFLRYQELNTTAGDWHPSQGTPITWTFTGNEQQLSGEISDQLNELERIMNFYQFSIHQGTQTVTDIVLLGDMPHLHNVKTDIQSRYPLPIHLLEPEDTGASDIFPTSFIPALGLALKGGTG